jgi:hypothetical protein
MASTYTLARTVQFVQRFIYQKPLTFTNTNDPAFAIGDWVRNLILGPPFAWRWNRVTNSTACIVGTANYQLNLPNFGWIEQASITDNVANAAFELEVKLTSTQEVVNGQPTNIAPWLDDNNGNITFRLTPPPDKTYALNLVSQNASPTFKTINDSWAPIPDYMQNVVQELYLAKAFQYSGDERFAATMQMGVRSLIAVSEGLSESQKNIFLHDFLLESLTQQNASQKAQLGNQSRNLL